MGDFQSEIRRLREAWMTFLESVVFQLARHWRAWRVFFSVSFAGMVGCTAWYGWSGDTNLAVDYLFGSVVALVGATGVGAVLRMLDESRIRRGGRRTR